MIAQYEHTQGRSGGNGDVPREEGMMEQREAYPGEEGVWRKQGEKGWRSL